MTSKELEKRVKIAADLFRDDPQRIISTYCMGGDDCQVMQLVHALSLFYSCTVFVSTTVEDSVRVFDSEKMKFSKNPLMAHHISLSAERMPGFSLLINAYSQS